MDSDWDDLVKAEKAAAEKAQELPGEEEAILMMPSHFYYKNLENASYVGYQTGYKSGEIAGKREGFQGGFNRGREAGVDLGVTQSARLWLGKRLHLEKIILRLWIALAVAVFAFGLLALAWICKG